MLNRFDSSGTSALVRRDETWATGTPATTGQVGGLHQHRWTHVRSILTKLGVRSHLETVNFARAEGLWPTGDQA